MVVAIAVIAVARIVVAVVKETIQDPVKDIFQYFL